MLRPNIAAMAAAIIVGVGLAACGSSSDGGDRAKGAAPGTGPTKSTPSQTRPGSPSAAETKVVRQWAQTLARGDVEAASRLFTLPTTVQLQPQGQMVRLTTRKQVEAFNRVFPCSAELVRAKKVGPYVDALFKLGGKGCDAPGASARTAFLIRGGMIARWLRLPDESDENPGGGGDGGPGDVPPAITPDGSGAPTV